MNDNSGAFLATRPDRTQVPGRGHHGWFLLGKLRQELKLAVEPLLLGAGTYVLDFGCADLPYRDLFSDSVNYIAADLGGNPNADIEIQAAGLLPISEGRCDVVLSTQVLEHVESPKAYLTEARRVLKDDGHIILSTHGFWPYHADPVDYWRWTADGLKLELERCGFKIESLTGIGGGLVTVSVQMFQEATFRKLPKFLQKYYCFVLQRLISWLDSKSSVAGRRNNALVYVVVASCRQ